MKALIFLLPFLFLFSCGDRCEGINVCNERGSCNDNRCTCDEGFSGKDCEVEESPAAITVQAITVLEMVAYDRDGNIWDTVGNPDLYVELLKNNTLVARSDVLMEAPLMMAALQGGDFPFRVVDDYANSWDIRIYDEDNGDDTFVGNYVLGSIYPPGEGLPMLWDIQGPGTRLILRLELDYEF